MNSDNIFYKVASKKQNPNLEEEENEKNIFQKVAEKKSMPTKTSPQEETVFGVTPKDILRQTLQYTTRGLESIAGLPGNLVQFAKGVGEALPEVPEFLHGKRSFIQEKGGQVLEKLPTTSDIRETIKDITEGRLEPQSQTEESIGDFVSDLASLKAGGFGSLKAAGSALLGNIISPLVEQATGSKKIGENTKTGLYFTSAMIRPGAAKAFGESKLQSAYRSIPQGETIPTKNLQKELTNFVSQLEKGGITPAKQPAYRLAKRLEKISSGNDLDVLELPATRNSINEFRFERELNPKAHRWLNKFDDIINKSLDQYGKTNPKFLSNYREGNEILVNVHEGNRVRKFISKILGGKELAPETMFLLGIHAPKIAAATAGASVLSSVPNVAKRMQSSAFRKYYYKSFNSALKENAPEFLKNVEKLDEEIKKSDKR